MRESLSAETLANSIVRQPKCPFHHQSEIEKLTNNLGCDVYFDAAGAGESVGLGVAVLAKLGRFVGVSVFPELVKADWSVIGE